MENSVKCLRIASDSEFSTHAHTHTNTVKLDNLLMCS